jgi:hypothetical protein
LPPVVFIYASRVPTLLHKMARPNAFFAH